jgi:hypothetical protein
MGQRVADGEHGIYARREKEKTEGFATRESHHPTSLIPINTISGNITQGGLARFRPKPLKKDASRMGRNRMAALPSHIPADWPCWLFTCRNASNIPIIFLYLPLLPTEQLHFLGTRAETNLRPTNGRAKDVYCKM